MPIITTAEYKADRGITGTGYDAVIGDLITRKQAWLERQCGRAFDQATYTDEAYCGDGTSRLWLNNWPVTALTAVKTLDDSGGTTTLESSEYRLSDEQYIARLKGLDAGWPEGYTYRPNRGPCFPEGDDNVLVTYTAGYTTFPEDLKELMYKLVDIGLDERGRNPLMQQTGDGVVQRTHLSRADRVGVLADLVRPWKRELL